MNWYECNTIYELIDKLGILDSEFDYTKIDLDLFFINLYRTINNEIKDQTAKLMISITTLIFSLARYTDPDMKSSQHKFAEKHYIDDSVDTISKFITTEGVIWRRINDDNYKVILDSAKKEYRDFIHPHYIDHFIKEYRISTLDGFIDFFFYFKENRLQFLYDHATFRTRIKITYGI